MAPANGIENILIQQHQLFPRRLIQQRKASVRKAVLPPLGNMHDQHAGVEILPRLHPKIRPDPLSTLTRQNIYNSRNPRLARIRRDHVRNIRLRHQIPVQIDHVGEIAKNLRDQKAVVGLLCKMRSLMQRDAVTVQQRLYVQAAHGGVVLSHSLQSLNRSAGKSGMQDIYAVIILRRSVVQDRCNGHARVGGVVIICGKNHRNLSGIADRRVFLLRRDIRRDSRCSSVHRPPLYMMQNCHFVSFARSTLLRRFFLMSAIKLQDACQRCIFK